MVRLPRNLSRVAVACSLALPLACVLPAWAQDGAAAPAAETAPAEPSKELQDAVANYWHYGKIGRYDLQVAAGEKILAHASEPEAVLAAFDRHIASTEFNGRTDNLEQWMLRWQGIEQVRDVTNKINAVLNEGRTKFRDNPAFIQKQIERLSGGARPFEGAITELRKSGELAVPMMIDYLRNPQRQQFHSSIRRGLRELGRLALNPLVAATEMTGQDNAGTMIAVVSAIGDIGYDDGVPFLVRVANDDNAPGPVREAARQALARMGAGNPSDLNAADLFYELAEKFYYENASITSDVRGADQPANVWYWSSARGLVRRAVPQQIFNEVMALRAAEYSLKSGGGENAQSLWLAANYKREAELPQGATDPTRGENQPPAHYYGVTSGTQYLNNALARALRDRNSAVALRVIGSLQDIAGRRMLESGSPGPLVDAMGSSDRLVRFEAAFALAQALPQQPFNGQERVVPLLAEALGQTGSPSILVIGADPGSTNALLEGLKGAGYTAAGAAGAEPGISAAAQLPAVDVIIISEEIGGDVDKVFAAASQNPRLSGASRIVITKTGGSPFATRAVNDRMLSVTQVTDPAALKPVIDEARAKGASAPLDQELANQYAARAGELLENLAISSAQVLDLMAAEQALLAALNDPRPDIVKSAGAVLARMDVNTVQPALLAAAQAEKPDDVKIALYKNLAQHAAAFGRQIEGEQVENLERAVTDAENLEIRAAAAEARGALNLPVEQAKTLIINQSTGTAPLNGAAPAESPAALR
ncbi:MAG TPA: hypothetical protein VGR35_15045 [Tepidisphaeraceae bacterium]|nr:hypothetical protein [Tepidisphaeraceae bacterium]